MSKFKEEIKQASSSKCKLVFVKVPDGLTDISVDNRDNVVRGHLFNEIWTSKKNTTKPIYFQRL
jgi:hypothetical protein